LRILNEQGIKIEEFSVSPAELATLLKLLIGKHLTRSAAKEVFYEMVQTSKGALEIVRERNLERLADDELIFQLVAEVIAQNPVVVEKYRRGKTTVLGFLIGEVMKRSNQRLDPKTVAEELKARIG
jgi:aspartyl-tRNA(Asn)/glutamyl-tRNA(Gln) amidotransferase subunit B